MKLYTAPVSYTFPAMDEADQMIMNTEIKPYLYRLQDIYRDNRRAAPAHISYSLYRTTIDYMLYWRELETTAFADLSIEAQDELYYWFTEKLLHIYEEQLDLYWLIGDLDNQPLFLCGREPARFWRKRLDRPDNQLRRFRQVY